MLYYFLYVAGTVYYKYYSNKQSKHHVLLIGLNYCIKYYDDLTVLQLVYSSVGNGIVTICSRTIQLVLI